MFSIKFLSNFITSLTSTSQFSPSILHFPKHDLPHLSINFSRFAYLQKSISAKHTIFSSNTLSINFINFSFNFNLFLHCTAHFISHQTFTSLFFSIFSLKQILFYFFASHSPFSFRVLPTFSLSSNALFSLRTRPTNEKDDLAEFNCIRMVVRW